MKVSNKVFSLVMLLSLLVWGGCKDAWEEHTKLNEGTPSADLLEEIKSKPELSTFAELLAASGLESQLVASKLFTVWAPTNDALNGVEIPDDEAALQQLLLNHISYERVNFTGKSEQFRHKMANGKYLSMDTEAGTIDGVAVIGNDDVAANGVLHMVSGVIPVKQNIWEYLNTTDKGGKQVEFILSQDREVADIENSVQIGVDPETGAPIYDTVMVLVNTYLRDVADLSDENQQLTYFLLNDGVLDAEQARFKKYYVKPTNNETDSLTLWYVLRDVVVEGEYEQEDLNQTFTSLFDVDFDVQQSAVIESYKASNGVVHVLSSLNVSAAERIKPIMIEAEYPYPDSINIFTQRFFRWLPNNLLDFTRARPYASSGYDIYLSGHRMNPGYIDFIIDNVNTVAYEMSWVAVHEVYDGNGMPEDTVGYTQSLRKMMWGAPDTLTFERELEIDSSYISANIIPSPIDIPVEQSLGTLTIDTLNHFDSYYIREQGTFRSKNCIRLRVQGSGNNTPIALDYLKMVPILE